MTAGERERLRAIAFELGQDDATFGDPRDPIPLRTRVVARTLGFDFQEVGTILPELEDAYREGRRNPRC